ncbi:MAG: hypothetical protein ABSA01_13605 [Anaerolineales bacterium]|jgi:hypothetical protein
MKLLGNIVLIIALATIVVPVGYLAWRADQPMDLPQFKGLTYYQYLNWRESSYHKLAIEYRAAYPNAKMGEGWDACFDVDTAGDLGLKLPLAGFYTLVGAFPNLGKYVTPPDRQYIPKHVTLLTFLPDWWLIYEAFVWDSAQHAPYGPVVYCRLQPNIPTSVSPDP